MDYKFLHFVVFYFDFDFTFCRFYLHFICVCAFIWGFLIIFFYLHDLYGRNIWKVFYKFHDQSWFLHSQNFIMNHKIVLIYGTISFSFFFIFTNL